jgi:RNA-binding protein YhbY
MNNVQRAAAQIKTAIDQLQLAKVNLRKARNDQHVELARQLAQLEELYDILMDPECTPEIAEVQG